MSIQTKATSEKVIVNGKRVADAWGNISMIDKNGKAHKFGGIPMNNEHYLTQALIEKTGIAEGESVDVEIVLKLNFSRVDHNPVAAEF